MTMIPPCPVCKSEIELDPHEVLHVYEGDGGVIIRENGNISTFGVQSPVVASAFNAATATPADVAGLVERLKEGTFGSDVTKTDAYLNGLMREAAATLLSLSARCGEMERALEPFAALADIFDHKGGNRPTTGTIAQWSDHRVGDRELTVEALRAARRAREAWGGE